MQNHSSQSRWNRPALLSVAAAALLLAIGVVRILSYSKDGVFARWLEATPIGQIGYRPEAVWSVRFFKILANPVCVAGMYFIFRFLNRGHRGTLPGASKAHDRTIDFRSPWLRLVLTTVVTLHWIPLEWLKFNTEDFYPYSPLESAAINAAVLLASQALSFFTMRYLSFEPLRVPR